MPDSNARAKAKGPEYDAGHVPMTEEFDDVRHSLPNIVPLLIALGIVVVVIGVGAYLLRAKPVAGGAIENVLAVQQGAQNSSFVAINVKVNNATPGPLYIKDLKAEIVTPSGKFEDNAASAVDYARYTEAYPDLKAAVKEPLKVETKIAPGASAEGTVLVSFPITKDEFDKRTSITVTIIPYDHPSVHITGK